jgi:hypothetical protein
MLKSRNKQPVERGDLVKCLFLGSPEHNKTGLVLERIQYDSRTGGDHPDFYSCRVLFDNGEKMVRGKWLKILSKNLEKEETCTSVKI